MIQKTADSSEMSTPRRTFNPEMTARYGRPTFDPDKLVHYSPKWQITRLMNFPFPGSHYRPRMLSVVISVDGGSRGNHIKANSESRAAFGVFWGSGCQFNRSGTLPAREPQTNNRAELQAVNQALNLVNARRRAGELDGWREIIIKTDSEYVHNVFNKWVWKWDENEWQTAQGKEVAQRDLISLIHDTILTMEESMAVRFWRVGRKWNEDADGMVNEALDD